MEKNADIKERPILFSGPMVRAIIEGRKTQTRRTVKDRPLAWLNDFSPKFVASPGNQLCPYGIPNDRLWVRESFWYRPDGSVGYRADGNDFVAGGRPKYKPSIHMPRCASRITLEIVSVRIERLHGISEEDAISEGVTPNCLNAKFINGKWQIPVNNGCPRQSSIGCIGCNDEWMRYGKIDSEVFACCSARESFESLWESINGPGSWAKNPWVWVVEFRMI